MSLKREIDHLEDGPTVAKRIKLEHKLTSDKICQNHPHINESEHEIQKFLMICSLLLEASLSKDKIDSTDSKDGTQDIILTVGKSLLKLLKGNIESLKLLSVIKSSLKKLKSFLYLIDINSHGSNKDGSKNSLRPVMKTNETLTTSSMQTDQIWSSKH